MLSPFTYIFLDATEGSETTSEPKSHKDLKEEVLSSYNNNSDGEDDDELPVDLLVKLERLIVQDGLICTPHDEPKVKPYLITCAYQTFTKKKIILGYSYIGFTA